jgi:hypothetical protein
MSMIGIALIHSLRSSPPPIEAAFAELWPEPQLMNLLDDSLSADVARDRQITDAMVQRFLDLADYALRTGRMRSCSPVRRSGLASTR